MVTLFSVIRRALGVTWRDEHEAGSSVRTWLWPGIGGFELFRLRLTSWPGYAGRRNVVAVSTLRLVFFTAAVVVATSAGCHSIVRWAGRDLPTLGGVQ